MKKAVPNSHEPAPAGGAPVVPQLMWRHLMLGAMLMGQIKPLFGKKFSHARCLAFISKILNSPDSST